MTKQQKTISLELAKKISEVAEKKSIKLPDSEWWYYKRTNDWVLADIEYQSRYRFNAEQQIQAFDCAELGEMLPITIHSSKFEQGYKWQCHYEIYNMEKEKFDYIYNTASENEAEARGKMYLYLIENNLLK